MVCGDEVAPTSSQILWAADASEKLNILVN